MFQNYLDDSDNEREFSYDKYNIYSNLNLDKESDQEDSDDEELKKAEEKLLSFTSYGQLQLLKQNQMMQSSSETMDTSNVNLPLEETINITEFPVLKESLPSKVKFDEEQFDTSFFTPSSRYFIDKSTLIKCKFCMKAGHILRDCPSVIIPCNVCRKDHDPAKCSLGEVCFRCGNIGHMNGNCTSVETSRFCEFCRSTSHKTFECCWVWRQYNFDPDVVKITKKPLISCYNCGSRKHFGDECEIYFRNSRSWKSSAFNADAMNFPEWLQATKSENKPDTIFSKYKSTASKSKKISPPPSKRSRRSSPINHEYLNDEHYTDRTYQNKEYPSFPRDAKRNKDRDVDTKREYYQNDKRDKDRTTSYGSNRKNRNYSYDTLLHSTKPNFNSNRKN
ncbi:hypothetical protein HDU92_003880 [Lobulomyces angularis]|nr:hypothetical protein HDU92_003880 [Lobulomyces angularis]